MKLNPALARRVAADALRQYGIKPTNALLDAAARAGTSAKLAALLARRVVEIEAKQLKSARRIMFGDSHERGAVHRQLVGS